MTLDLRCKFCEKLHDFEEERKLNLLAKEKIDKIERLKEEVENGNYDLLHYLLYGETRIFKLLNDLEYEKKNDALHNIVVLEAKLIKLEISPARIDRIKNSVLLS